MRFDLDHPARRALIMALVSVLPACGEQGPHRERDTADGGEGPMATAPPRARPEDMPPPFRSPANGDAKDDAPEPGGSHAPCVLSVDCPAGDHCDLGECIQDCNTGEPCAEGSSCSPRGRCLKGGEDDRDPDVSVSRVGTLTVTPGALALTERDDALRLELTSSSTEPVRYRVEIAAPHLVIRNARGTFTGKTTLELPVNTKGLVGKNDSGRVRVVTTLGDAVVTAPIQVGISGMYEGTMTYDAGSIPLGTVGVVMSIQEDGGRVVTEIDPARSLLFPSDEQGTVTGEGVFRPSLGAQFSFTHVVGTGYGGERNHFGRPISRQVSIKVAPDGRGSLSGTFEERVEGLMTRAVTLAGKVTLNRRSVDLEAQFASRTDTVTKPPLLTDGASLGGVFAGWKESDCESIRDVSEPGVDCSPRAEGTLPGRCESLLGWAGLVMDLKNYRLGARLEGAVLAPVSETAAICEKELSRGPLPLEASGSVACTVPPRLACVLSDMALSQARGSFVSDVFSTVFSHVLEPALLVSQNQVVESVRSSFVGGPASEVDGLKRASATLDAPARWVLSPRILEYLAGVPAAGLPAPGKNGTSSHIEALRKLSRLFFVLSTVDGELSRVGAATPDTRDEQRTWAQQSGVLTLLEAASVVGVLDRWGQSAPADVGVEFTDVLTPMELGFQSLLQGALVFGVPEGLVPLVHQSGEAGTNFHQVLADVEPSLTQFASDEALFKASNRDYEQNDDQLEGQLLAIQTGLETAIYDICGPSFDAKAVMGDASWATCGQNNEGDVGALILDVQQARNRLEASLRRAVSLNEKIRIETARVEEVKEIRDGTIAFINRTGDRLVMNDIGVGALNVAEKMVEMASQSSVMNFGLPAAGSAVVGYLEGVRTGLTIERERLETAQEARLNSDNADVEVVNGMAGIQAMTVDLAQLATEMQQDLLGILQAQVNAQNAVNRAKRLFADRAKSIAHASNSPARDPSFRILQDGAALKAILSRAAAQRGLYLAARALEYELNQPFGDVTARAVFNAFSSTETSRMNTCLKTIASNGVLAMGQPQTYSTELSVRKQLGIDADREDPVTGERLTMGDQFRRMLLKNENLDGHGGAGISFSSSLSVGNGLWPANVCDDKVTSLEAQLVGDFAGDNDAQVEIALEDGGVLRRCDREELVNWSTKAVAVIQAGVNSYGTAPPNFSLRGLSVASSRFRLVIPGKEIAPANADLDLRKVEDIVLRIKHEARPVSQNSSPISLACLNNVGTTN